METSDVKTDLPKLQIEDKYQTAKNALAIGVFVIKSVADVRDFLDKYNPVSQEDTYFKNEQELDRVTEEIGKLIPDLDAEDLPEAKAALTRLGKQYVKYTRFGEEGSDTYRRVVGNLKAQDHAIERAKLVHAWSQDLLQRGSDQLAAAYAADDVAAAEKQQAQKHDQNQRLEHARRLEEQLEQPNPDVTKVLSKTFKSATLVSGQRARTKTKSLMLPAWDAKSIGDTARECAGPAGVIGADDIVIGLTLVSMVTSLAALLWEIFADQRSEQDFIRQCDEITDRVSNAAVSRDDVVHARQEAAKLIGINLPDRMKEAHKRMFDALEQRHNTLTQDQELRVRQTRQTWQKIASEMRGLEHAVTNQQTRFENTDATSSEQVQKKRASAKAADIKVDEMSAQINKMEAASRQQDRERRKKSAEAAAKAASRSSKSKTATLSLSWDVGVEDKQEP